VRVPSIHQIMVVEMPSGDELPVVRRRFGDGAGPRVAIVAGIRGDAPEGIRVAHTVARFLEQNEAHLRGTVDVYPCANPLAAHQGARLWPFFDVDLNRLFPGNADGHPPHRVAWALSRDVAGADQVVELRGANPHFREATQAHVRRKDARAAELAAGCNVAVVWRRAPGPGAPGTFAAQVPGTIVLEGGTGNRLTPGVGKDLSDGVLHLLAQLGVLDESRLPFHWAGLQRPAVVGDEEVRRVRAERGGLFLPEGDILAEVAEGQTIGSVVDPLTGEVREEVRSPAAGRLLAIRVSPVVFPGSTVARVVTA
jgi:predicted deacylase